jgi:hypothetical protein
MNRYINIHLLLLIFFIPFIYSQEGVLTSYNLFDLKSIADTEVSHDGKLVVYTVNIPRPFIDKPGTDYKHLFVLNIETGTSQELYPDKESVSSLRWSPGSKSI